MLAGLEGKVALVTGAGRGLGRAEALELAGQGVRVVVNDYGRSLAGEKEDSPADEVVAEIKAAGGEAVADYGDVADWDDAKAMVHRGIDEWGSLDIVVNNAGFMRDKMIFSMSEEDFDSVVRVHLKGHFCVLRHTTEYWREKGKAEGTVYGRVINTGSESGISGAVGQPNYSSAKGGIVQLTINVARAMQKYGVTANAICPRARTRMTADSGAFTQGPDESGWDPLAAENVTPLVAYLASPASTKVSGQVFVAWGKEVRVMDRPMIARRFLADEPWTPEAIELALSPFFEGRTPVSDGYGVDLVSDYWRRGE